MADPSTALYLSVKVGTAASSPSTVGNTLTTVVPHATSLQKKIGKMIAVSVSQTENGSHGIRTAKDCSK